MFYFLSKILLFLINPLCWLLLLAVLIYKTKVKSVKRIALVSIILMVILGGNKMLLNEYMSYYEPSRLPIVDLRECYKYGVVLVGDNQRYSAALNLYKDQKIEKICILGRLPNLKLLNYLHSAGVDIEDIWHESKSKNTYEHALNFHDFMLSHGVDISELSSGDMILITSAIHMDRATRCFDHKEIVHAAYPVDQISYSSDYYNLADLIPSNYAFLIWHKVIKEEIGKLVYRLMGYC